MTFPDELRTRIRDKRGGRVAFVAHCILNENTRYLGGACRSCSVTEIVDHCLARGIGLVQMPCPEERAWGGVLKRRLLRVIGARGRALYRWRGALTAAFTAYTRLVFGRIARRVASQMADYHRSGFDVVAVIGIDGSPSCGVRKTLDRDAAVERLAAIPADEATADRMNAVILDTLRPGAGMFTAQLQRELARRGVVVPFVGHSLIDEMRGLPSTVPAALGD